MFLIENPIPEKYFKKFFDCGFLFLNEVAIDSFQACMMSHRPSPNTRGSN